MQRFFATAGALSAFVAVAAGAFAAHALRDRLPPDMLQVFETAARYQMYHAVGLLLAGFSLGEVTHRSGIWAGRLFLLGTLLFSGSLYALALTGISRIGMITPFGGVAFLAGWVCLAMAVRRR